MYNVWWMGIGKLSDLWQKLRSLDFDDPERFEIQKQINEVESWMISKGYKTTGITKWNVTLESPNYPDKTGYLFWQDLYKVLEKDKI